jgi:maleate isomerase
MMMAIGTVGEVVAHNVPTPRNSEEFRVGIMIPASDAVVERDLKRFLPERISFHVARLMQDFDAPAGGTANLDGMIDYVPEAARALIPVEPDLVLFCCTSASFYRGPSWNRELDAQVGKLTWRLAISTSTALLQALQALKAETIFLVTPYPDRLNENESRFFSVNGVRVSGVHTFNCTYSREIADVTPDRILSALAKNRSLASAADCTLISCTGLRSLEIAEEAEHAIGRPVITSNMASLWAALEHFGVSSPGLPSNALFTKLHQGKTTIAVA